jgi:hypothetical protein
VSAIAANTNYPITINHTLSAGLYFLATNSQAAAATNNYVAASTISLQMPVSTTPGGNMVAGWFQDVNVTSGFGTAASLSLIATPTDVWIRKT